MKQILTLYLSLISAFHLSYVFSQETEKTVTVKGVAHLSGDLSMDEATAHAINSARVQAIQQAAGVTVFSSALLAKGISMDNLVQVFTRGFIVKEEIIDWETNWQQSIDPEAPPMAVLTATIRATVNLKKNDYFRHHMLDVETNRQVFRDNDAVTFTIKSKENVYVLIVNYTSSGKIVPLFPNHYSASNYLLAGRKEIIPAKNAGWSLQVVNSPGKKIENEAYLIFGFPKDEHMESFKWKEYFPFGKEINYVDFYRSLSEMPLAWMAQEVVVYTVRKN